MSIKSLKLGLLAGVSVLAVAASGGAMVLARGGDMVHAEDQASSSSNRPSLSQDKMKACRVHERVINNKMQRIAARGQRHMNVFDNKAQRVETFATAKGIKPADYDSLVADVDAKKVAAQEALDKVKSDSVSFKCDGTDPKGVASSFKADLKAEVSALQAYKKSIRNLLVAVMTANHVETSDTNNTGGTEQ